jgi:hypothetical protein
MQNLISMSGQKVADDDQEVSLYIIKLYRAYSIKLQILVYQNTTYYIPIDWQGLRYDAESH